VKSVAEPTLYAVAVLLPLKETVADEGEPRDDEGESLAAVGTLHVGDGVLSTLGPLKEKTAGLAEQTGGGAVPPVAVVAEAEEEAGIL